MDLKRYTIVLVMACMYMSGHMFGAHAQASTINTVATQELCAMPDKNKEQSVKKSALGIRIMQARNKMVSSISRSALKYRSIRRMCNAIKSFRATIQRYPLVRKYPLAAPVVLGVGAGVFTSSCCYMALRVVDLARGKDDAISGESESTTIDSTESDNTRESTAGKDDSAQSAPAIPNIPNIVVPYRDQKEHEKAIGVAQLAETNKGLAQAWTDAIAAGLAKPADDMPQYWDGESKKIVSDTTHANYPWFFEWWCEHSPEGRERIKKRELERYQAFKREQIARFTAINERLAHKRNKKRE